MCGITAVFSFSSKDIVVANYSLSKLHHRGPDQIDHRQSVYYSKSGEGRIYAFLGHTRLSIVDIETGAQPFETEDYLLVVNGEIYNHQSLRSGLLQDYPFQTKSDCEVIIPLFDRFRREDPGRIFKEMQGIYAFVIYHKKTGEVMIARDGIGVIPLYYGKGISSCAHSFSVASEMKGLPEMPYVAQFPPGHFIYSTSPTLIQNRFFLQSFYLPVWRRQDPFRACYIQSFFLSNIREKLSQAVKERLMCDVPWGVLLSGGLDSSLIASIASRYAATRVEAAGTDSPAWFPSLHTFSIGLEDSPDLKSARLVSDFLGTIHHEFIYTLKEGLDAIPAVISHVETFDVTTIRSSTPMYLMARKIKEMGFKVVLSGEGADEIFGGYLYFHKAPNPEEMQAELIDKVNGLYQFDCLRANKSMAAWGVEARVPFLDTQFLEFAMMIDPALKMIQSSLSEDIASSSSSAVIRDFAMEKYILRKAFDTPDRAYLPDEILWRQKEQFSDGVGYGWIDAIKDRAEMIVTDSDMTAVQDRFSLHPPTSKEEYWFRTVFERLFPGDPAVLTVPYGPSVACSTARALKWDESFIDDPSGRSAGSHISAY